MSRQETHNHILDTAIGLFWRSSYHGVNMNELSREAGLNKATVYQHFASKEELAVAAVERAAKHTLDFVFLPAFESSADPLQRLKAIYQNVFQSHKAIYQAEKTCLGCPFVNIGVELATSSENIRRAVNQSMASFQTFYEQIAEDFYGAKSGPKSGGKGPKRKEIASLVAALLANMNGCLVASKLERRPEAILDGCERAEKILKLW